jgi:hypothetical protein
MSTIARYSSRAVVDGSWSGASSSAILCGVGHEQDWRAAGLHGRHRPTTFRRYLSRAARRLEGEPDATVLPFAGRAGCAAGPQGHRVRPRVERLEHRPLLEAGASGQHLDVGIADDRVAHPAQRRQHAVHQLATALGRAQVDRRR